MTTAQSAQQKKRFLEKFRQHGNITWACRQIRMSRRQTVYDWQEQDDQFAAAFRQAEIEATERMEEAAYERGVKGVLKPVYQQGAEVGKVREYSDTLLIFMLKARAPEKYRENVALHHSGRIRGDGQPRPDLSAFSLEELELYERLYSKATGGSADA